MIGLYDYMTAVKRYQSGQLRKDDARILWAGISTASNSGADILLSDSDYGKAILDSDDELHTQLSDGHDVDDMINWTSQQDWCWVGFKEFEKWLVSN